MGNHAAHTAGGDTVAHTTGFGHAHGQGLLDEDMLARSAHGLDDLAVERRRNDYHDRVEARISQQTVIVSVVRTPVGSGELLPCLPVPTAHGCEFRLRDILNEVFGVAATMFAGTDEADPQHLHDHTRSSFFSTVCPCYDSMVASPTV